MRVAIRADASPTIGAGHMMRCLTLADALARQGASVTFLTRASAGPLLETIRAKGLGVRLLADAPAKSNPAPDGTKHDGWLPVTMARDAQQSADVLSEMGQVDWLIVDHYALDCRWERQLRPLAQHIMAIDDLADRKHDCDLLLDQNYIEAMETRYDALVPLACRNLIGPGYAMLRPEFLVSRRKLHKRDGTVRRILILFGGADPSNESAKALGAIHALDRPDIEVDVVLGALSPHIATVQALVEAMPGARLHVQVSNVAELMATADLAIGAGGSVTWERCCLGLPTITVATAANQSTGLQRLSQLPAVIHIGEAADIRTQDFQSALTLLFRSSGLAGAVSRAARELVDGRGVARVLSELGIDVSGIMIRKAVPSDAARLLAWRNHPNARAGSLSNHEISPLEHKAWLDMALDDPSQVILIGEIGSGAIGMVRYTIMKGNQAKVSIALDPGHQASALGEPMLRAAATWLSRHRPEIVSLTAEILPHNQASIRIFRAAGFTCEKVCYTRMIRQ